MNSVRTIFPLWMIAICVCCIPLTLLSTSLLHSQTWEGLNGPPKARDVRDISVNSDGSTIYVCDKSVLFKSTNGGTSWGSTGFEISSPLAVVSNPGTPATVIAGIIGSLMRSTNGGTAFTPVYTFSGSEPLRLSVSPMNPDRMYMGRKSQGSNGSILRSLDAGLTWSVPANPYGTNINDIAAWPSSSFSNEVWAVGADPSGTAEGTSLTTRGAWQSTDLGVSWTEKGRTHYNVRSVAIKDAGPIVFIGTDATGKIFSSLDHGSTWSQTTNIGGAVTSIRSLKIRSGSEVWAATNAGIHKSTNNGTNWTPMLSSGDIDILSFTIAPSDQNLMYATTAKTVWKTTNGGSSWSEVTSNLGRMPVSSAVPASTESNSNIWTASNVYDSSSAYTGSSSTWVNTEMPNSFYGEHIMRASTGLLYWSGRGYPEKGALYTTDGVSYNLLYQTAQSSGNIFNGTMVDPQDATKIYLWGKDGSTNFYRIANYGAGAKTPFTVGGSSYTVNDVAVYSSSGPYYYGLNNTGGVWKCDDIPCTGTQTALNNMTVKSLALRPNVPDVVYAAGTGGLRHTSNGGALWYLRYGIDLKKVILPPGYLTSKTVLILTADGQKILSSTESGSGWTEVQGTLPKPIREIRGVEGNDPVVYASTDQGVYRVYGIDTGPTLTSPSDGAQVGAVPTLTWSTVSGATNYHLIVSTNTTFTAVVLDQMLTTTAASLTGITTPGGTYYWKVAAGNFAGATYSTSYRSFTTSAIGTITLTGTVYLGADQKFHPRLNWTHSGQGGSPTFYLYRYSCAIGAGDCGVWPYPFILSTTATTYDDPSVEVPQKWQTADVNFYYQVRSAGISNKYVRSAVDGPEKQAIVFDPLPSETKLYNNYPNPFNPTTTFRYDLAENAHVSLKVYDVLGEEVATLVDEEQEAGYKSVEFDAGRFSSGVYFYRFSAESYQIILKMILIK